MPTYEYECKTCGKVMDLFQSITAAPLRKAMCENCKAERPVRRLIGTGGGLIFKGSGFYQTDYRSEGYKTAAKADSPGDSSSGSDAKKSDSTKGTDKKDSTATTSTSNASPTSPSESESKAKSQKPSTRRKKS